jgi:hypothetical protein
LHQVGRVLQTALDGRQRINDSFEGFFFAAEILSAFGIFPDGRVFELAVDLFEFLRLQIEVKDTSGVLARARSGRRAGRRGR